MVQQMIGSKINDYGPPNAETSLPNCNKQQSLKKTTLRDVENDNRSTVTGSSGNVALPQDRGLLTETSRLSGIKRSMPEFPQNPPCNQSSSSIGTNGHLVYARRKPEQESVKGNHNEKVKNIDRPQQERCNHQEQELPLRRTANEGPKQSSFSAFAPIPATTSATTSSGGPSVPHVVNESPPRELNYPQQEQCNHQGQESPLQRTENEGPKQSSFSAIPTTTSYGEPPVPHVVKSLKELPPRQPNYPQQEPCNHQEQEPPLRRTENEGLKQSSFSAFALIPTTTSSGVPSVPHVVKSFSELPPKEPNYPQQEPCNHQEQEPPLRRTENEGLKQSSFSAFALIPTTTSSGVHSVPHVVKSLSELPPKEPNYPQQEQCNHQEQESPLWRIENEGPKQSAFSAFAPISTTTSPEGPSVSHVVKSLGELSPSEPTYSQQERCNHQERESPWQRTENERPRHSSFSAFAPIVTTTSSGGPSVPHAKSLNELPPREPNHRTNTPDVFHPVTSQMAVEQYWKERFNRLQTKLGHSHSNQEEYIHMLRGLSPVGRSKHAVELEKRAIQLSLEEGYEIKRMKDLNVLGKS